jgi:hypothetical protein
MQRQKPGGQPDACSTGELVDSSPAAGSRFETLPSVWYGSDAELLEQMLDFYPRKRPKLILDATVNQKRFWVRSKRRVIGMDINAAHQPDVVGDNRRMPFRDQCFDVVVYDPPHVPNQGKDNCKDFNTRFGLVLKSPAKSGYNFTHLYRPFLAEAYRVLKPEGILLCKIADYVHGHRFQWAHVEVIKSAVVIGFCACDCIIKVRKGPIMSPRWKTPHHARRHHCYWLIFRKSEKCE